MINSKYTHILWDWNGTLLNDAELSADIDSRLRVAKSLSPISLADFRDLFSFPMEDYYRASGFNLEAYSFRQICEDFMQLYEAEKYSCSLHAQAREVLSLFKSKGLSQSILSAYVHDSLVALIEHFGLTEYFDHLSGHEHIYPISKVDQGRMLLKKLNVDPGTVLMIGDTVHDSDVAAGIGVDCVLLATGCNSERRLRATGRMVYRSLGELII